MLMLQKNLTVIKFFKDIKKKFKYLDGLINNVGMSQDQQDQLKN